MKKQRIQFCILVGVLVLFILAYFGVEKYNDYADNKAAEEELLSKTYITQFHADSVEALYFEYAGEGNAFVKEDDVWYYEDDRTLNVKQDMLNTMAQSFAELEAQYVVRNVTDLAQYGLEEPARVLSFTVGEVKYVWNIGDANALTGEYYMYDEADSSVVYTVSASFVNGFNYGISGLVEETEESSEEVSSEVTE